MLSTYSKFSAIVTKKSNFFSNAAAFIVQWTCKKHNENCYILLGCDPLLFLFRKPKCVI